MMKDLPPTVAGYWAKRRVWDRFQEERHPVIGRILEAQRRATVEAVREFAASRSEPLRVADLCCGTGWIACDVMALDRVASLLAVDISQPALRRLAGEALRLGLNDKLSSLSGNIYELDWGRPESFDVIICMDALHHLPDIPGALAAIRRRLRPDGIFIGNLRAAEGTATFFRRYGPVKRLLIGIQPRLDRALPERSVIRRWLGGIGYFRIRTFTGTEVGEFLNRAGFKPAKVESGHYHWFSAARTS